MNILILNGSPSGQDSITLFTALYIQKHFPAHRFDVLHVGQRIKAFEKDFAPCLEAVQAADLLLFCYPVYTFLAPSQLHRFIELLKPHQALLEGKWASQVTTSKHFYDVTAHRYIRDNCADLGLRFVEGLSADMDDLLTDKGRREALSFFRCVEESVRQGWAAPAPAWPVSFTPVKAALPETPAPKGEGTVALVTDLPARPAEDDALEASLRAMIARFTARAPQRVEVVNLRDFPFAGGCLGCFRCAADGQCVYRDGFDALLRDRIQTADATVYAFAVRDHSMGSRFKMYDDRQFCNGHRTVTMGKPVAYLVSGPLAAEENLRLLLESRAQVGGNFLAGVATDEADPDTAIDTLAARLTWALQERYLPPKNFYGVGGMKIFRDLIYQMRGLMRADHRFYKAHGFYRDMPHRHQGRIAAMYLVGAMMNHPGLRKKAGGRLTEGMVGPYRKALEK
ncbi:MAG: NAD(P)H-dependent oxidoreductase [Clostridia bacterium]|nr:NAD(P)H-dependent oxidoreductase [Clostridia bacterium]